MFIPVTEVLNGNITDILERAGNFGNIGRIMTDSGSPVTMLLFCDRKVKGKFIMKCFLEAVKAQVLLVIKKGYRLFENLSLHCCNKENVV